MRRIVLMLSVSLDGFFEGPKRELDWQLVDEELHEHFNAVLARMSAFFSGRLTYELMAKFWPTADEDPSASKSVVDFAQIWREMPKIVFSRTLEHAAWNTSILRAVEPAALRELAAQPGGDIALGGADLATAFFREGLVDELRLYVHPILLGAGRPLFHALAAPTSFALIGTHTFTSGVVLLHYRRR